MSQHSEIITLLDLPSEILVELVSFMSPATSLMAGVTYHILRDAVQCHLNYTHGILFYYNYGGSLELCAYITQGKKYICLRDGDIREQDNIYVARYDPVIAALAKFRPTIVFGDLYLYAKRLSCFIGDASQTNIIKVDRIPSIDQGGRFYYDMSAKILAMHVISGNLYYADNVINVSFGLDTLTYTTINNNTYTTSMTFKSLRTFYMCATGRNDMCVFCRKTKDLIISTSELLPEIISFIPCIDYETY